MGGVYAANTLGAIVGALLASLVLVPWIGTQQTQRVLENLKGILGAAGSNLHHVVKTTVFLKDMNEFAAMNEVYGNYFTSAPPARSTVQVSRLPKDALVEIEVIAGL